MSAAAAPLEVSATAADGLETDRSSVSLRSGRNKGGRGRKGFAAETAKSTGLSKSTLNELLRISERITDDVKATINGTEIAKVQAELSALANLEPDEQRRIVALVLEGSAASVREAVRVSWTVEERQLLDLNRQWRRALPIVRAAFLFQISTGEL